MDNVEGKIGKRKMGLCYEEMGGGGDMNADEIGLEKRGQKWS